MLSSCPVFIFYSLVIWLMNLLCGRMGSREGTQEGRERQEIPGKKGQAAAAATGDSERGFIKVKGEES